MSITKPFSEFCPEDICVVRDGVTYGEIRHELYYSATCRMERPYNILLPPSYDENKKYPVLYMLHGIFGDENALIHDEGNHIPAILGNLIADGLTKEMIIVFPHMYATDDPEMKPDFDQKLVLPYDNFINELTNDLMPCIESRYPVLTGRDNTYLMGFSMGGRETLFISFKKPELFRYICAVAPAPGLVPVVDRFMEHAGVITPADFRYPANGPDCLILTVGDSDSVVVKTPYTYHDFLAANHQEHIWYDIAGVDHNCDAIRSGFYNMLRLIGSED